MEDENIEGKGQYISVAYFHSLGIEVIESEFINNQRKSAKF